MTRLLAVEKLIDEIISRWRLYHPLTDSEIKIRAEKMTLGAISTDICNLSDLRNLLNRDEWEDIPIYFVKRCSGKALIRGDIKKEKLLAIKKKTEYDLNSLELQESRKTKMIELRSQIRLNFLGSDSFFSTYCSGIITEVEFKREKISFVTDWINTNALRKNNSMQLLDIEQVAAISSLHGHIQVIARAGSGKTTTLVNRTFFLLKHCSIDPNEILILAFNRKAALEIRRRLIGLIEARADAAISEEINSRIRSASKGKRIDKGEIEASAIDAVAAQLNITLPHVMTFHALAYAIVHPEESILFNGSEGESQGLSRVFQKIIDEYLQDSAWRGKIQELMLAHFREDWDRIVAGKYDQSKEDLLLFRRSMPLESISGDYVKSYGEKLIADFLFEHDIAYKYERNHWWSGINYRPDFTIFKSDEKRNESGVIIEYFGMKGDVDYDEMSNDKRNYWADKKNWILIEFSPEDIASEGVELFLDSLKAKIEQQGITCSRLSEDEIWHRIRDRAIDRFTAASVSFIGRCRKRSLAPAELQYLVDCYSPLSPIEAMFLNIVNQLYTTYLDRMSATGEDDFDGLMQRSADVIASGNTNFLRKSGGGDLALLKYLCVDEFQDFSDLFYGLLDAIRIKNPQVELFCVGDDWQAINGFAGSDLKFFRNFDEHFEKSQRLYISTNYRSSSAIVSVGNELMKGLGKPAVAHKQAVGRVLLSDLNSFEPTLIEKQRHPGDIITPAVLRIANQALAEGKDVVLLCRRNALPWFVNFQEQADRNRRGLDRYLDLVRSFFPKDLQDRITISTAHKYKGLEKPMVIVLDAVARSYPLIHPDWVFSRILGDSAEKISDEERRLFYVALTRAVETLVVITDGRSKSPFLEEIERTIKLSKINWSEFNPPAVSSNNCRLVVNVSGGSYQIRDLLKACKYNFHSINKCWEKSFPTDNFNIDLLKNEVWSSSATELNVKIFNEANILVSKFSITDGNWNELSIN